MATTPTRYRATDYPPKYRPVGYWRHARRDRAAGPPVAESSGKGWRFWVLIGVMLATLVLHAGIAAAYFGSDSSSSAPAKASQGASDEGGACAAPPSDVTDPNLPGEEDPNGVPNDSSGTGNGGTNVLPGGDGRSAL